MTPQGEASRAERRLLPHPPTLITLQYLAQLALSLAVPPTVTAITRADWVMPPAYSTSWNACVLPGLA